MPTINKPKKKKNNNYTRNKELAQRYVYNTDRWSRLRTMKLMANPLCEKCLEDDRVSAAIQVHHITPFMQGTTIEQIKFLGFDYDNLMSLCEPCHQKKHQIK